MGKLLNKLGLHCHVFQAFWRGTEETQCAHMITGALSVACEVPAFCVQAQRKTRDHAWNDDDGLVHRVFLGYLL